MQERFLLIGTVTVAIVVASFVVGSFFWFNHLWNRDSEYAGEEVPLELVLAPEVTAVLNKKDKLISAFLMDPVIIEATKASNAKSKLLSKNKILELDNQWRSAGEGDSFIKSHLTNVVAIKLIEFQKANPEFSEVFVVDAYGLNTGQTNRTTDYYQADEDWWVKAFNEGNGKSFYGSIEFDESAQTEGIAVYAPVIDSESGKAIGVIKSIINLDAIKMEL